MADDFVSEKMEDYKEEETHFHVSVTESYDDQHDARLVLIIGSFCYWQVHFATNMLFILLLTSC